MVKSVLTLAAAIGIGAVASAAGASAADMSERRSEHRQHREQPRAIYANEHGPIRCTTTEVFGFLTTSDCGQGFDPLGTATN